MSHLCFQTDWRRGKWVKFIMRWGSLHLGPTAHAVFSETCHDVGKRLLDLTIIYLECMKSPQTITVQ